MDFRYLFAAFFLLVPAAWLAGLDQFLLYAALPLLVVRALAGPLQLPAGGQVLWGSLLVLLAAMALSVVSLFDAPSFRWITYLRDVLAVATLAVILLFQRPLADGEGVTLLVVSAVWFMFVANLVGLVAWATGLSEGFLSPAGWFMPDVVLDTDLGAKSFEKHLLRQDPTYLFGFELTRVRSFFIYPNTYALAIGVTLPMTWYLLLRSALLRRWAMSAVYAALFAIGALAMVLSLSRSGIAALAGGFAIYLYLSLEHRIGAYARLCLKLLVVVGLALAAALLYRQLGELAYDLAYARGAGSYESRLFVYYESFRQLLDNPVGFGTQRDVEGLETLPLGSHSQFVAVAYKFGFAGLAAWLAFLALVTMRLLRGIRLARRAGDVEALVFYTGMAWAHFTNLAHQLTAELLLDTLALAVNLVLWLAILIRPLPGSVSSAVRTAPQTRSQALPAVARRT